jgi:heterodisulfide reductase subunit A
MTAALTMADQGFHVHLVERERYLGGFARQLTETLEGDSPETLLRHVIDRLTHHPHISLYLQSRLVGHKGQVGAFEGAIQGARGSQPVRYGVVVVATGAEAYKPAEYLYGEDPRIMTQVELARRLREDPSWGRGIQKVAMIQCVGSRDPGFPACSRVCCSAAVKNSLRLKEINPAAQIVVLYRDVRTFGFKELYYLKARQQGVLFFRYIPEERPEVSKNEGRLVVDFTDRGTHEDFRFEPDVLVLSSGMRPHEGAEEMARLLKLPRTEEGFFLEAHVKLRPVEFASQGVFLAGTAHSPRFLSEAITMAQCAGQQATKILSREEMRTLAAVAVVDPERCTACLACVRTCPFQVPVINEEGVSEISASGCRGCGVCTAVCPRRAITLKHGTDDQMNAKIDALLASPGE